MMRPVMDLGVVRAFGNFVHDIGSHDYEMMSIGYLAL